jgi:carboxypeptidase family protein
MKGIGSAPLRFFIAAAMMAPLLFGQQTPGITISVRTPSGDGIPGITVQIDRDGFSRTLLTETGGWAFVAGLGMGEYKITVSGSGFEQSGQSITVHDERQEIEVEFTLLTKLQHSDSIDVTAEENTLNTQASPPAAELHLESVADLPLRSATVAETLVLVPGVNRDASGQISISGAGEEKSAMIVNSSDVTDPATGFFGSSVPADSVDTVVVFKTPFLPQYGRFTAGVVAVETKRGGDKWRFSVKEPIPDFRVRSKHIRGLRDATPRISFSGPLIKDKLFFSQSGQYRLEKKQSRTLSFPNNESKDESVNSFSQFDYIISTTHFVTATVHIAPQHINYVDPQFFNPQPVTPSFRGYERMVTAIDHLTLHGGLLDSTVSRQDFNARVGAQGDAEMVLTPTGNLGNYFARRHRNSSRLQWMETYSVNRGSAHALKFGSVVDRTTSNGDFSFRPINIQDSNHRLLERIEFAPAGAFQQSDTQEAIFAQDHWTALPSLSLDGGVRAEYQAKTSTVSLAPRAGAALSLFHDKGVVVRGGFGFFYDRVPLNVFSFGRLPARTITTFNDAGEIESVQETFINRMESDTTVRLPLVWGPRTRGNFAPYSRTWNVEVERAFARIIHLRVNYQSSNSGGGILLTPRQTDAINVNSLGGGGKGSYRQFEMTATMHWSHGQQMMLSYVRSKALSDLNQYSRYLGNYPIPLIRPNVYTNSPADLPNRFIAWGVVNLPANMHLAPMFEYRTGQPFAILEARQNYVGTPYSDKTRFRSYVALDQRISRDFRVMPKATLRLSGTVLNALNHFNPLDVHANTADPQFGTFFGHYKRRYRLDFEMLF